MGGYLKHNNYSNIPDIDVRGHLKHNNYSNIPDIDVRGHLKHIIT